MIRYSARSQISEGINAITERLLALRARGEAFLDLTESNPTAAGLAWDADELSALLHDARASRYTPDAFGALEAREAVSQDLARRGLTIPADQIFLTASTSEAYGYLFKLLCDPGDNVLVPAPSYPLFDMLAQLEGVELVRYPLAYDGEWHLTESGLTPLVNARTRAVLAVHPNNPTGSFLKQDELARLSALGLPILSDEVFADYAHAPDARRAESALRASDRTLVFRMGGLSKALLLPQLKLAWTAAAGPAPEVAEALRRLSHLADTYLSAATPVQLALPRLLERAPHVQARLLARIRANLAALQEACLPPCAAQPLRVEGGWYAILRLPNLLDDEAWTLRLLEQDGVLVQPGFFYDLPPAPYVVVSLITEQSVFGEGIRRLTARVAAEATG